jgi:hypothetical protein
MRASRMRASRMRDEKGGEEGREEIWPFLRVVILGVVRDQ